MRKIAANTVEKRENIDDALFLRDTLATLVSEVRQLRKEVNHLKTQDSDASLLPKNERPRILVAIDRIVGERKPFILRVDGGLTGETRLSSMRAAIFMVLFIDLQDRLEGGPGITDKMKAIVDVYSSLDENAGSADQLLPTVRVGLYRFELFLKEVNGFNGPDAALEFRSNERRLDVRKSDSIVGMYNPSLSISSADPAILSLIDRTALSSPIARVRKQKSMYISASAEGWDQLFLEFFDHPHKVRNTSMYYRFALPTYPDSLLDAIGASAATRRRKDVMLKGYKESRVEFLEMISRETLWDTIKLSPRGGFKLYPPNIKAEQVAEHLKNIITQLGTFENYRLVLTDAPFPFIVGIVEILSGLPSELFALFYRQLVRQSETDVTCFVLNDALTAQSVFKNIVSNVLEHASSVENRDEVKLELEVVLDHLLKKGPIKP